MLSNDQVDDVERRLGAGESFRSVAAAVGIGLTTVVRIRQGKHRRRSAAAGVQRKRDAARSPHKHTAPAALCPGCTGPLFPGEPCLLCKVRARQAG